MAYEPRWKIEGYNSYGEYLTSKRGERAASRPVPEWKREGFDSHQEYLEIKRITRENKQAKASRYRQLDREEAAAKKQADKDYQDYLRGETQDWKEDIREGAQEARRTESFEAWKDRKDARERKEKERTWETRKRTVQKVSGEVAQTGAKVVTGATGPLISILRGFGRGELPIPRGIVHPDKTVRNKELYLGGIAS